ncbi:MAG TPA: aldo/keto reductase, partial [Chroococcales cyanobacterium]
GDFRRKDPRYQGDNFRKNMAIVQVVNEIGRRHGATGAQIAIAWTLHQGDSIVPIPGTKRVGYLEENVAAHEIRLDKRDLEELNALAAKTSGPRYEPDMMARVER